MSNFNWFRNLIPVLLLFLVSCQWIKTESNQEDLIASVGESKLYLKDIPKGLISEISELDSAAFVSNYVNRWAVQQLLLQKAQINLSEDKIAEFDRLVAQYKTDLLTNAYKEALIGSTIDTTVVEGELSNFLKDNGGDFQLSERILRLRYVQLPPNFLNPEEVKEKIKNYHSEDKLFLDSISLQFDQIHLNDSLWIAEKSLLVKIPPLKNNDSRAILRNSQFFELEDSTGIFLGKVHEILEKGDVAPLSYIRVDAEKILMNQRRFQLWKSLEKELLNEALENKELIIYE